MFRISSIVLVVMFVCSLVSNCSAITRYDDIDDSEYLNLASTAAPFGGRIYSSGGGWYGSGGGMYLMLKTNGLCPAL